MAWDYDRHKWLSPAHNLVIDEQEERHSEEERRGVHRSDLDTHIVTVDVEGDEFLLVEGRKMTRGEYTREQAKINAGVIADFKVVRRTGKILRGITAVSVGGLAEYAVMTNKDTVIPMAVDLLTNHTDMGIGLSSVIANISVPVLSFGIPSLITYYGIKSGARRSGEKFTARHTARY